MARSLSALEGHEAVIRLQTFARELIAFLDSYDALLTRRSRSARCRSARSTPRRRTRCRPSPARACSPRSLRSSTRSGVPAISFPLYMGEDGLPTAVQIVGRPLGEANLLALGAQLEEACPWADRRSPVARELQA